MGPEIVERVQVIMTPLIEMRWGGSVIRSRQSFSTFVGWLKTKGSVYLLTLKWSRPDRNLQPYFQTQLPFINFMEYNQTLHWTLIWWKFSKLKKWKKNNSLNLPKMKSFNSFSFHDPFSLLSCRAHCRPTSDFLFVL